MAIHIASRAYSAALVGAPGLCDRGIDLGLAITVDFSPSALGRLEKTRVETLHGCVEGIPAHSFGSDGAFQF